MKKKVITVPDSLKEDVNSLKETIAAYFGRPKTPSQLWELFDREQAEMQRGYLADPKSLDDMLANTPYYVSLALFQKLKFKDHEVVEKLMKDHTSVVLADLQAAKCVEVGKSIRPLLDVLLKRPELMKVMALCAFAERAKGLKLPPHP